MRRLGIAIAVILAVFVLSTGAVDAETAYEVDVDGSTAEVTASFDLYSDDPVNYWTTSFGVPEGSRIVSVEDTHGDITDYSLEGSTLRVETNKAERRTKETVTVEFTVPDVVRSHYNGVRVVSLSLSGYEDLREDVPDEVTTVAVRSDERILAESHSFGFESETEPRRAVYEGEGPVNIYMTVGDGGKTYDHYRLFGDGNLTRADELYSLVPSVTGFEAETAGGRHPVVSLPDDVYDEKVNRWSQGQYRTGGLILVRESVLRQGKSGAPVVLHEVTHAYNEEALRWSRPRISWFNEGTAQYVEFVATNRVGARQPEIFGETVKWEGDCKGRDGDGNARCVYRLPPRKTPEDLWEYYRSGSDFMVDWSPDNPRNRAFGYAFSELAVRNYARQNGEDGLRDVYSSLLGVDRQVSDSRESNQKLLSIMETDLRPCYSDSRSEFGSCLDSVNEMQADISRRESEPDRTVRMSEGGTSNIIVENTTADSGTDSDSNSEPETADTTRSSNRTQTHENDDASQTVTDESRDIRHQNDSVSDLNSDSDSDSGAASGVQKSLLERLVDGILSRLSRLFGQ
ncbi:MAG: hypothetical protein SV253_01130 [Halobacteria archaeon]|nr:hypothetical protein [Halobacteria archaeon]